MTAKTDSTTFFFLHHQLCTMDFLGPDHTKTWLYRRSCIKSTWKRVHFGQSHKINEKVTHWEVENKTHGTQQVRYTIVKKNGFADDLF